MIAYGWRTLVSVPRGDGNNEVFEYVLNKKFAKDEIISVRVPLEEPDRDGCDYDVTYGVVFSKEPERVIVQNWY